MNNSNGIIEVNAQKYMKNASGHLVPLSAIKAQDLLQDELVRKILYYARDLNAQMNRFYNYTQADILGFDALLAQEYDAKLGGKKGNSTLMQFDGLGKIQVHMADKIVIGSEIQIAKQLIDECLLEWGAESHEAIRALVNRVFNVDKEGQINKADLFSLTNLEINDERWKRAVAAIRDSMKVIGTKKYIRFYDRANADDDWNIITIDIAQATRAPTPVAANDDGGAAA